MNLYYLRYFVTLAHVQQYTKAAEQLCIAQPSLSHAISQLEKELGLPLFEKKGKRTALTERNSWPVQSILWIRWMRELIPSGAAPAVKGLSGWDFCERWA